LALIGALLVFLVSFFVTALILGDTAQSPNEDFVAGFVFILIFGLAFLFLVYGIVAIVSGKRLMEYKKSGRTGTMVISALNLFNIPIGTIFGVFALYVLTKPEAEQLFT
jgi:hypothetical protein